MDEILKLNFVLNVGAQEILGTLFALALAAAVGKFWKDRHFAGWSVTVIGPDGQVATERNIGRKKMELLLDDDSDLSVFVKGLASPFGWLAIDLVEKGREMGALVVDKSAKKITIDLSVPGVLAPPKGKG